MTDIAPERILVQQEEVAFNASVSEATASRMGAVINHIAIKQLLLWQFNINGPTNAVNVFPNLQMDGILAFPFDWELVYLAISSGNALGSGGTTELDLKWKPQASGSYASICSTTPKFTTGAAANQIAFNGQSITGFTAPVLSKTLFDAYNTIRFNMIQSMTGDPEGAGLALYYRPR